MVGSNLVPRSVIALFIILLVLFVKPFVVTVSMSFRVVICPVGPMVDHCKRCSWRRIIPVPGSGYISTIIGIDVSRIMSELPVRVIVQVHAPNTADPPEIVIGDHHVTGLDDPSIIVIKDRNMFYLYHGPEVIVLDIGIVVIS